MALENNQDLLNFFDPETHGKNASITISGTASSIKVILNKEYFEIPGETVDVDGSQPIVHCRSSDVTGVDSADTIVIDTVNYNIKSVQPDGTGVTILILQEA
jgi:hypothetical protein